MRRRTVLAGAVVALAGCASASDPSTDDNASGTGNGGTDNGGDPDGGDDETGTGWFDTREIEAAFLERYNSMREEQGLATTSRDRILSEMGQEHAENMAENDYIGHQQPDTGMTIADRYERRGLLPKCELPTDDGSGSYYPGAENAAGAAVGRVTHPGTDETFTVVANDDVAEFLMSSWMTSPGHRAVMELTAVRRIGLGTAVRDDGEIFAALEFC